MTPRPSSTISFLPFPLLPLSLSSLSLPFVSVFCFWAPPQIQLGGLGRDVSFRSRSGWSPANKRFLMHSEFKITLPMIALLQKFSDNQVCIVTRIGLLSMRHTGIVFLRNEVVVWF